jgi:ATP-binding protein involved in chromosome partitioning
MEEKIKQIAYGVLCDESHALTGTREISDIAIKDDVITVTIAIEKANEIAARVEKEDAIRDAIKAAYPDHQVRIISIDIAGEEEPACAHSHESHSTHDLPPKKRIPGVKHVYLVCSAKGGVGKSTVALNTALALSQMGRSVGLLDLDLYGPSIPSLVGSDLPPIVVGNLIVPPEIHGMSVLSIGFMIDKDQPLLWRGPMVAGVINQLLFEVDWSGHDTLIIDMPPGTGDTYLTILQSVEVDAAILVTTPSEIALADAKRGVGVFEPYHVPVAGIVENMGSYDWEGRETVLRLLDDV